MPLPAQYIKFINIFYSIMYSKIRSFIIIIIIIIIINTYKCLYVVFICFETIHHIFCNVIINIYYYFVHFTICVYCTIPILKCCSFIAFTLDFLFHKVITIVSCKQAGESFKSCACRCWNASIASMMWFVIMPFLRRIRDFGWICRKMPYGVVGVVKACVTSVIAGVPPLVILLG